MSAKDPIESKTRLVARLERKYALEKIKERKKDTRRKIQLGGLVIKAKMDQYSKDTILGALLDIASQLSLDEELCKLYQLKGKAAFLKYGDNENG